MLELLAASGVFGTVTFSLLAVREGRKEQNLAQERILRALGRMENPQEEVIPLSDRVVRPLLHKFASNLARIAPQGQRTKTESNLSAAGLSGQWECVEWQGLRYALGVAFALMLLIIAGLEHKSLLWRFELGAAGFLLGYLFPESWLKAKAKERRKAIENSLPDVLDLLTVSVEAGLGFDAALLKVVEKQKGVLAEEFLRVLQEIKMGRPRREALRDLSRRNQVEDLSNVVASLVQADQLGIAVGGVLRNQAAQIRQKHRQSAEEKAQKAPVKMMIPLVFFVFPGIFIIILGPAVIQVLQMFRSQ